MSVCCELGSMLLSSGFRSVKLISGYCLNLVTSALSCNTVYTYTAACKYILFSFIFSVFLFIFFTFWDYALGGGQINYNYRLVSLLPFVPSPQRLSTRIPFDTCHLSDSHEHYITPSTLPHYCLQCVHLRTHAVGS